jgi:hypothetical protein
MFENTTDAGKSGILIQIVESEKQENLDRRRVDDLFENSNRCREVLLFVS